MAITRYLLIIVMLFSFTVLRSQETLEDYYELRYEVNSSELGNKLYDFVTMANKMILTYPNESGFYHDRGRAKFMLNDYNGAIEDFLLAKEKGYKYRNDFYTFITSKDYAVGLVSEDFIDHPSLSAANGYKPVYGLKDSLQGGLRPERTCFDVYYYNLTVKILPKTKSIEGVNDISFTTIEPTSRIQIDLTDNYTIHSIKWNDKALKYQRVYNAIFVQFEDTLPAHEKHTITITYSGIPRVAPSPPWDGGFVWEKKRSKHWVGVACEHLGASSWWPCKDHLTEKPDSMTINIQVPSKYKAISNGNLKSVKPVDQQYTNYEWFVSYPINSYGVTFYMGDFVNFNESFENSAGTYKADYYVLPHHLKLAKTYYAQTREVARVFEKLYGDYPYMEDGVAMIEAPYAGMEHQSAIAIGDRYGRVKPCDFENTDYDYLVVHEFAHEWWGNTVTMDDMADVWISEGFATYSEHLFLEEQFGYEAYLNAVGNNMTYVLNIWPMVGIRDVNDNAFIGGDVYHKGAAMLNNLRCIINNDTVFFGLIKGFYNEFKFKTISSTDFVRFTEDYTALDLDDFFDKFMHDTEPPVLEYKFTLKHKELTITYKWINVGDRFTMPFSITINDLYNVRLEGTTQDQSIKFTDVDSFYLPHAYYFNEKGLRKNAFTYYWAKWVQ